MPTSDGLDVGEIKRLDDEKLEIVCYKDDGTVRDISNDTLTLQFWDRFTDPQPLLVKSTLVLGEIVKTDPENGVAEVHIDKDDFTMLARTKTVKCVLINTDVADNDSSIIFKLKVVYRPSYAAE